MRNGDSTIPFIVEKARINLYNLIGFACAIAITAFGWGTIYNSVVFSQAESTKTLSSFREEIREIKAQIPTITQIQYNLTRLQEQVIETRTGIEISNKRIDRVVESFENKLDNLNDTINKMNVRLEVLTVQLFPNMDKHSPMTQKNKGNK